MSMIKKAPLTQAHQAKADKFFGMLTRQPAKNNRALNLVGVTEQNIMDMSKTELQQHLKKLCITPAKFGEFNPNQELLNLATWESVTQ